MSHYTPLTLMSGASMHELQNHEQSSDRPQEPTRDEPKGWAKLPCELRARILENICSTRFKYEWNGASLDKKPRPRLARFARVCREWQWHFESITFRCLVLEQIDLDRFKYYISRQPQRIAHLRWIHLRLALLQYDCRRCWQPENEQEQADNNEIFTAALHKFFVILADGCQNREVIHGLRWPLELELSAYAQSDWAHGFKSLRYRANGCQSGRSKMPALKEGDFDDRQHGWDKGRRTHAATKGECLRVLGGGLQIRKRLPAVPIVSSFLIRRQFYRRFEAEGCLDIILAALPNLARFRYEPWGAIPSASGDDAKKQLFHYRDLVDILEKCPKLEQVSIYEDFEDFRGLLRLPHHTPRPSSQLSEADDEPVDDAIVGCFLAEASRHWKTAHLSFMVEAAGFFHDFWPGLPAWDIFAERPLRWENLTQLCLTSTLLSPTSYADGGMDLLLHAAARASMMMPKLQCLTLWTAGHRHGCFFRYRLLDSGRQPRITLASTWNARLSRRTRRLWDYGVARILKQYQRRGPLEVQYLKLRCRDMGAHGALLPLLRDVAIAAPGSQIEMVTQSIVESDLATPWRRTLDGVGLLDVNFWMHTRARPRDPKDKALKGDEVLDVEFELVPNPATSPAFPAAQSQST